MGWDEWLDDETNIGVADRNLLTPIDTLFSLDENSGVSIDVSDIINTSGEHSFALGVLNETDSVLFYSKEVDLRKTNDWCIDTNDVLAWTLVDQNGNLYGYTAEELYNIPDSTYKQMQKFMLVKQVVFKDVE